MKKILILFLSLFLTAGLFAENLIPGGLGATHDEALKCIKPELYKITSDSTDIICFEDKKPLFPFESVKSTLSFEYGKLSSEITSYTVNNDKYVENDFQLLWIINNFIENPDYVFKETKINYNNEEQELIYKFSDKNEYLGITFHLFTGKNILIKEIKSYN